MNKRDGKLFSSSWWTFWDCLTFSLRTREILSCCFCQNLECFSFELSKCPNHQTTDSSWKDFTLVLAMNSILFLDHLFSLKVQLSPSKVLLIHYSSNLLQYLHRCRSTYVGCVVLHLLSFWTFQCVLFWIVCNVPCMFAE